MTSNLKAWLMAFVMGILIPGLLFSISEKFLSPVQQAPPTESRDFATQPTKLPQQQTANAGDVFVLLSNNTVAKMDMQTYLTGVLLAEMPVEFENEALKAQAVVARTYALRRNTLSQKHMRGAICTDSACCQGYRAAEDFLVNGGSPELLDRMVNAVSGTEGQVLTYNGTLIEATYFSCSGGRTEDALAVWGTDIPYLQAVDSPGEEGAVYYTDAVQFTADEFAYLLGISPKGPVSGWFGAVTYTHGGGIDTMVIAGKSFSGITLRQKLGLRSTALTINTVEDVIHISTRGFGHRVGMSQYGAEAMAVRGCNYKEILSHYYPGTFLSVYTWN